MGGIVALTVRFSDGEEWRGACGTWRLPCSLFAAPFYDPKTSEAHTRAWLHALDAEWGPSRPADSQHDLLAPFDYGIVIIDYAKKFLVNAQGYYDVDRTFVYGDHSSPTFREYYEKWSALKRAGRLYHFEKSNDGEMARIKLPLSLAACWDGLNVDLYKKIAARFVLSPAERATWRKWIGTISATQRIEARRYKQRMNVR